MVAAFARGAGPAAMRNRAYIIGYIIILVAAGFALRHMWQQHLHTRLLIAEDGIEDVRDGLGWTAAITQDSGRFVLSASGERVAFVVFGACAALMDRK